MKVQGEGHDIKLGQRRSIHLSFLQHWTWRGLFSCRYGLHPQTFEKALYTGAPHESE